MRAQNSSSCLKKESEKPQFSKYDISDFQTRAKLSLTGTHILIESCLNTGYHFH